MRTPAFAAIVLMSLPSYAGEEIPVERQGTWAITQQACTSSEKVVVKQNSVEVGIGGSNQILTDFITSRSCYGHGDPEGHIFCIFPGEKSGNLSNYQIEINNQKNTFIFNALDKTTDSLASVANKPLKKCK